MCMKVIGLTGGIACGKTLATKRFQAKEIPVIDTDQVARQLLTHSKEIQKQVKMAFGTCERAELRKRIFNDSNQRKKLETILHPEIHRVVKDRLEDLRKTSPSTDLAVVVVPLLFEAGWESHFDSILSIICGATEQITRLVARDEISNELAQKMVSAQLSNSEKAKRSDFSLTNDGDIPSFEKAVDHLIQELQQSA